MNSNGGARRKTARQGGAQAACVSEKPALDVFGVPPRVSTSWQKETVGRFAGMHTVGEMKRTSRREDWDQATAIGVKMLEEDDQRGWLHEGVC